MTKILELKERLCSFYGNYDIYIKPAIRFVLAILVFFIINNQIGYMSKLKQPVVVLVLSMLATFLPVNVTVVLGIILILVHLSALSLEACLVAALLFLLLFLIYFRYAAKSGYNALVTPLLCCFRIPEVMPTVLGLCKAPYSVLATLCSLVIFYFLKGIKTNEVLLSVSDSGISVSKFTLVLQQLIGNRELYVVGVAFLVTTLVIYVIRRQAVDNAWMIAIGVGNALNLTILLLGGVWFEINIGVLWRVIGTVLAVLTGFVLQFFLFHLDYSRTERVQFEDDEYYYYVKAVPKVYVSTREKQVKQINSKKTEGINKKQLAEEFDIDQDLLDV